MSGPMLVVNTFRMRAGVSPQQFTDFSARIDQPLCTAHADIVTRFDVYLVGEATAQALDADVVEVFEVTDWDAWIQLRDNHPSLTPVMSGFDELVEPDSVRSSFVTPIVKAQ